MSHYKASPGMSFSHPICSKKGLSFLLKILKELTKSNLFSISSLDCQQTSLAGKNFMVCPVSWQRFTEKALIRVLGSEEVEDFHSSGKASLGTAGRAVDTNTSPCKKADMWSIFPQWSSRSWDSANISGPPSVQRIPRLPIQSKLCLALECAPS